MHHYLTLTGTLVIQARNSKIDFNMEALSISCRNKYWSQYFNRILFSSTGYLTICLAVVVQAALESRAASTTTAWHSGILWDNQLMKSKFDNKYFDQCLFLQLILSASILKSIFEFRTWITNVLTTYNNNVLIMKKKKFETNF